MPQDSHLPQQDPARAGEAAPLASSPRAEQCKVQEAQSLCGRRTEPESRVWDPHLRPTAPAGSPPSTRGRRDWGRDGGDQPYLSEHRCSVSERKPGPQREQRLAPPQRAGPGEGRCWARRVVALLLGRVLHPRLLLWRNRQGRALGGACAPGAQRLACLPLLAPPPPRPSSKLVDVPRPSRGGSRTGDGRSPRTSGLWLSQARVCFACLEVRTSGGERRPTAAASKPAGFALNSVWTPQPRCLAGGPPPRPPAWSWVESTAHPLLTGSCVEEGSSQPAAPLEAGVSEKGPVQLWCPAEPLPPLASSRTIPWVEAGPRVSTLQGAAP